MRHRKSGRKLNRNSAHRKALFKNLAIALIEQDIIKTTLPKAKELRKFVEPLITIGKEDTVANRRHVFSKLRSDQAVAKLFSEVSVNAKDRKGGYSANMQHIGRKELLSLEQGIVRKATASHTSSASKVYKDYGKRMVRYSERQRHCEDRSGNMKPRRAQ